ncbi:head maturation protease, ClpP-related, partial [Staphylococcus aureus]|uniref:head maturation protease, ClpP-related n=2 Tax=Staphylococcus TaxID=1279 RepID=UPI00067AC5F4
IADSLPDTNEDIDVIINSGGGDVYSGSEIYTSLKTYPGKVNIKIVGVAASAASVIAMAGDHIEMSPTSQMMIHNAWTMAMGDINEMQKTVDMLDSVNKGIANAYINKTGKTEDEILSLMNKETWFNAQDAVEHGFADSKMFDEVAPRLVANSGQMLSDDVINRVTALVSKTPEMKIDIDAIANKVIEKMNIKNEKPKNTINESGFNRFLF